MPTSQQTSKTGDVSPSVVELKRRGTSERDLNGNGSGHSMNDLHVSETTLDGDKVVMI